MTSRLAKDRHGWAAAAGVLTLSMDAPGMACARFSRSVGSVRGSMNTQLPLDTKLTQPGIRLHWPADAEFAHASLERGALHTEQSGGSLGAGDAPLRLLERTQDVLALSFFESGNRGA